MTQGSKKLFGTDGVRGLANRHPMTAEIALALGLSVKTIEAHRTRIMEKLKIHNVAGLTRYAISRGITTAE